MRSLPSGLDAVFLALVVFVPAMAYLPNLGFYSDDWPLLQKMSAFDGRPVSAMLAFMLETDLRPFQGLYAALRYLLFGLHPAGYHVVNHLVILAGLILLVAVLRRLGVSRWLALAAATIFGLMPSYSTLRFWMIADVASLSLLLYLVSLWADLRPRPASLVREIGWRVLSAVTAASSVLAYELCLPLLFLNPFAGWWYRQGRPRPQGRSLRALGRPDWRLVIDLAVNGAIVLAAAIYKVVTSPRAAPAEGVTLIGRVLRLIRGVVNHHGLIHGVYEPVSVWTVLTSYLDLGAVLVAIVVGVGVGIYLYLLLAGSPIAPLGTPLRETRRRLWAMVGLGVLVLVAGYAIFLTNDQFYFSAAGSSNRLTEIGSLGVAIALAGIFGLLGTLVKAPTLQRVLLGTLVGVYCGTGVLIFTTIASFWEEAYRRETAILADIQRAVPTMAPNSTLLLDGECPYVGPAVVFESHWDLQGLLQLIHRDPTLRANVVSPRMEAHDRAVTAWLTSPDDLLSYPYADGITVYDRAHDVAVSIRNAGEMNGYVVRYNPERGGGCPFGWSGNGVTILPRPTT